MYGDILAQFTADVGKKNSLQEGTLKDAITQAISYEVSLYSMQSMTIFSCELFKVLMIVLEDESDIRPWYFAEPVNKTNTLTNSFNASGSDYIDDVKPEFLNHFLSSDKFLFRISHHTQYNSCTLKVSWLSQKEQQKDLQRWQGFLFLSEVDPFPKILWQPMLMGPL